MDSLSKTEGHILSARTRLAETVLSTPLMCKMPYMLTMGNPFYEPWPSGHGLQAMAFTPWPVGHIMGHGTLKATKSN